MATPRIPPPPEGGILRCFAPPVPHLGTTVSGYVWALGASTPSVSYQPLHPPSSSALPVARSCFTPILQPRKLRPQHSFGRGGVDG